MVTVQVGEIRNHHVLLRQIAVIQHKSPTRSWQNNMAAKIQQKSPCRAGKTTWWLVIQNKSQCTAGKARWRLVFSRKQRAQLVTQDGGWLAHC
jgi:hypothetical protein